MKHAAVYVRISSLKDDRGVSVERQIDECIKLALSHGFPIDPAYIYLDNGVSGKNLKRPAIQRLIAAIQANQISRLYVWDLSRLSRSVRDTEELLDLFAKHKVEFIAVNGFADISTPEGEMMTGFQAQLAQYWRKKTSKAIRDYYATLRADNIYLGRRPPFGLVVSGNGKQRKLSPHPETFPIVRAFLEMYADELAFAHVRGAELLVSSGLLWRDAKGNPRRPKPIDLQRVILLLPLYLPFLPVSLARRVQNVRAKRKNHKENSNVRRFGSLLRRVIACAHCESKLWMHRSDQWTFSYRHPFTDCAYAGKTISHTKPDEFVLDRLADLDKLSQADRAAIRAFLVAPAADPFVAQRAERQRIQNQLDKLVDEWLEVGLTPEQFRNKRDKLQERLTQTPAPPDPPSGMDEETADALMANLYASVAHQAATDAEIGNRIIAALFRQVTYNFQTKEITAHYTWE